MAIDILNLSEEFRETEHLLFTEHLLLPTTSEAKWEANRLLPDIYVFS
jgi:hypothetical protein